MPSTRDSQEAKIAHTLEAPPIHTIDIVRRQGLGLEGRRIGIAEGIGGSKITVP